MITSLSRTLGIAVAAAVTLVAGCTAADPADSKPRSIVFGLDPTTYGRIGNSLDSSVLGEFAPQALYESLWIYATDEMGYEPELAASWEVSDDGFAMDITLREDVDFSDGTHLDARAVADYYQLLLDQDPPTNGLVSVFARDGLTFEVTGEYELRFTTSINPMGPRFMADLASGGAVSSPSAVSADLENARENYVGTGPYLVVDHVPGVSMTLERNPAYRDPGRYPFDEITFLVFDEFIAATNALKAGQIDAARISSPLAADIEANGFHLSIGSGELRTLRILDYDGRVQPALADVRVRQAIAMAFDQQTMLDTLEQGYGFVSDQPYPEGWSTYLQGEDDQYPYDVERAKELLAEAGYPDGFDVTLAAGNEALSIYPYTYEAALTSSLADIGIRVTYDRFNDAGGYIGAIQSGKYPIQLARADYTNVIGSIASNPAFVGHYADDQEFMDLVFDYQSNKDGAGQLLGEYLRDQLWYVVFYHTGAVWAIDPEVQLVDRPGWTSAMRLDGWRPAE